MDHIETGSYGHSSNVVMCLQHVLTDWLKLNFERNGRPKFAKTTKPLNGNIFEKIVSR